MKSNSIKSNLWFLLTLWLLSSAAAVWFWMCRGDVYTAVGFASKGFIVSWGLASLVGLSRGKWMRFFRIFLVVLGVANLAVDEATYNLLHDTVGLDDVSMVMWTNPGESSEFFQTYMDLEIVAFIAAVLALCALCYVLRYRIAWLLKHVWPVMTALLFVAIAFSAFVPASKDKTSWSSVFVCKASLIFTYDRTYGHQPVHGTPEVELAAEEQRPENVVIVIGESLSRSHCSLYGYGKSTNPSLEALLSCDSLIVFTDVTAAYYNTVYAIRQMLSASCEKDDKDWASRANVFDVLHEAGYETSWISNQTSLAVHDNPIASIAALTDTVRWLGVTRLGLHEQAFDGVLAPSLGESLKGRDGVRGAYFLHMMGCHENFSQRYPADCSFFAPSDYDDLPANQRRRLSEYDNAVRYTDQVIGDLCSHIADRESILIFVPDHGLDLYETDPRYCAHARRGEPMSVEVAQKIPMVIYASAKFRNAYPKKYERLCNMKDEPFNTRDLIYLIMDICGIKATSLL